MLQSYQQTQGRLLLCPSILSADFAALGTAVEQVSEHADVIHVDIMDGHYVPNLTIGPAVVAALRTHTDLPLDVHLMVADPIFWIQAFAQAGADTLVFHAEACTHGLRAVQQIRSAGCSVGVAINPGTSLAVLEEYLPVVDMVLLMTVNPGFGGQSYIPTMTDKITRLYDLRQEKELQFHIQIDGGIHLGNIRETYLAGADMIVVGHAVYGQSDPVAALQVLRQAAGQQNC